jgi:iron(III) transport system substrate-binding protein
MSILTPLPGRRRRTRLAALAATVGLVVTACGGSSDSVDTTAPADLAGTTLTVYSGRSEALVADLFARFTADTGIKVNARYGDSGELAALLLTEGEASPADVYFSQDAGALGAVESLLATLPGSVLDKVDAKYSSPADKWVGVTGRVRVMVYNPDLVPAPPTSIDDLLDPSWKGRLGFAPTNASWQSFVTGLRVLRGEDGAREWLEGFAANQPKVYEKNGAVRDAVNSGEIAVGLVNHYYLYEKIAAEGAAAVKARNQYLTAGDPGGLINVAGAGILAGAGNAAAARVFIEWLLGETASDYFRTKTFEYLLVKGAVQPEQLPAFDELEAPAIDLSDLRSIEETQELLQSVGLLTR